jgi:putative component of membrane protein insertase Oxa1/YidC/SpoIIIJ protein YidD
VNDSKRLSARRFGTLVALSVLTATLLLDAQTLALGGIHVYQRVGRPLVARAGIACRFTLSCSHYAEAAITRDGFVVGGWKTLARIARCGPWTPSGTVDPPP